MSDVTRPVCEVVSTTGECPTTDCSSSQWGITANITDGVNGTGIESVTLHQGNGTLNTSLTVSGGVDITVASYSASCCSQSVELRIIDKVGNVQLCAHRNSAPGLHSVCVRMCLSLLLLMMLLWS